MEYTVAILTMSSKHRGYCVAGIDIDSGNWIRLVSDDAETGGALSRKNTEYRDGSHCKPLDVVRVPVIRQLFSRYQPENVLIDETRRWEKTGTVSLGDILKKHPPENHGVLLGNRYKYITEGAIGKVGHSLILVRVTDLTIVHLPVKATASEDTPPREKTKASFTYRGCRYENISVTDPNYYPLPNRWHTDNAILVMSLPEKPFNEKYYFKFIAKIFPV